MLRIDALRNFIIMLALSGSPALQAVGENDPADTGGSAAPNERADRESRNRPSLDAATGVRYVITADQIRRFDLPVTFRSVPGMEVVGMHTGSSRAR